MSEQNGDARISEIRARHYAFTLSGGREACFQCIDDMRPDSTLQDWPCDTALLLTSLDALTAERDARIAALEAEVARLKLTTRSDREYAEIKQRAEEAEAEIARLREAARTVLDHIDDVEWAQDSLRHDEDTERLRVVLGLPEDWVSAMRARAALAASEGATDARG